VIGMPDRHQMIDRMTVKQQVVCDNSAMASPPDGFRAHQCETLTMSKMDEFSERGGKFITQSVIGVVVETLHAPHRVKIFIDTRLLSPPPAQGRAMPVANL